MSGTYAPSPVFTGLDSNGDPVAAGLLFTYLAGTSTKVATYTDVDLSSANTNPIVLDSAGRATIFLDQGVSYKFVLAPSTDTDPPTSPIWTRDNIQGVPASELLATITGTAGEALSANDCVYLSAGDGSRTAGRWYKADADNDYASSTADAVGFAVAAIASGSSGDILLQGRLTNFSGLTAGTLYFISATAGGITATAPTNYRGVGVADSTTSLVVGQFVVPDVWNALPDASATVSGIVNLSAQTLGDGLKHFKQRPTFDPGTSDPTSATTYTSGVISVNTTQAANSGTSETDLMSYTIPANVLDHDGAGIRVTAWGVTAATANNKTIKVYFDGTAALSTGASTLNNYGWTATFLAFRTGVGAQDLWTEIRAGAITAITTTLSASGVATDAADETAAIIVKVTGQSATASNDIIQHGMIVEILY